MSIFGKGSGTKIAPKLMNLVIKLVRYSKDGLDKEEKKDLAGDLFEIALELLNDVDLEG